MIRICVFAVLILANSIFGQTKILLDPGHDYATTGKTGPVFKDASGKNKYAMVYFVKGNYSLEYVSEDNLEYKWICGYRFYDSRLIDAKTQLIKELSVLGQLYRTNEIEAIADAEE
jgi:hypothetical protein